MLLALGALALAGCDHEEPIMPLAITSLAVLPAASVSAGEAATRVGEAVTAALYAKGSFRVVGAASVRRLLAGPEGQDWIARVQDQTLVGSDLAPNLARALGTRLATNGLALPEPSVVWRASGGGRVSLKLGVYEAATGRLAWRDARGREFAGPEALDATLAGLARALVIAMPAPARPAPSEEDAS